ncbi:unnamed protein product [Urochloa humidicola]
MDPDQITAAAADGVQHDDLGDATTYADGGGTDESWGRALLRRGWDLSRKAAIAGVAATAAPVVVPQLLILSVAGLALSLPFAAYLASFAATERLMGALLPPPPRAQPYSAWDRDLDEDEFLDASEAPSGEAHVFEYGREAEDEGIVEEDKDESYPSLPLSREPRLFEEPVPPLSDDEGALSEGGFRLQELGHESNVLDSRVHKEEDDEYITMEALPPQGIDDLRSAEPEFSEEEDDSIPRIEEALVAAEVPVQELSASDSGDKTEDGERTAMQEMEFSKEMVSPGIDVGTTEVSDFPVPILDKDGITEVREGEYEGLVGKSGQESLVSDAGEKTEEMLRFVSEKREEIPPQEVNVSESSVPDDNMLQSKIEDIAVEMALEEVISNTNPVTEEVVDVQMDVIATEPPECEPLHPSDLVAPELQAMAEAAYVDDVRESSLTEDVVMDIGYVSTDVTSVFSAATADDVVDLPCSTSTPNVSTVSDDTMNVESRPDVDHSKQTTGVECTLANKGFRKKEQVEDKSAKTENNMDGMVHTRSMAPQDIDVSTSPVPDDQCKREDEVAVEMVLEEVTSTTDLVTGEVVGVQVDIMASGSDFLPLSDLVAQELQVVTEAATVDSIQGSGVRGDIVTDTDDTENVEHHSEGGASSFISGSSVVTMDEAEDVMSSRIKPYVSAISEDTMSVEGNPDVGQSHKTTDFEHKLTNEGLKKKVVTEDKDNYTEEQLREQLDTLRTITGYRSATSSTLEADLAGLYIFVGVEPPVSSRDASDLTEINMKLQFLKSIIGVE